MTAELAHTNSGTAGADSNGALGGSLSQALQLPLLLDLWRIIARHKWWILSFGAAGFLLGLAIAMITAPTYRASVRLEVNSGATQIIEVKGSSAQRQQDLMFIETQLGLLRSRSLAERVVRKLGLANNPQFVSQGLPRERRMIAAAGKLANGLEINPQRGSRIIDVGFVGTDPAQAAQIANSYADNYIQSNLDRNFDKTAFAREFLRKRLETQRVKLEDSERGLVEYARVKGLVSIQQFDGKGQGTSTSINNTILGGMTGSIAEAERKRITAEENYRQIQRAPNAFAEVDASDKAQQAELAQLQAQYAELRQIYKPAYPELIKLQKRIDVLKGAKTQTGDTTVRNLVQKAAGEYQAALAEEREIKARLADLKSDVMAEREQNVQYTILQREVDTNRTLYDSLLQQFKEVSAAGGVTENPVAIVDRADVPTSSIAPNVLLHLALGSLIGLAIGLAVAFIIDIVNNLISSPSDVEIKLGIRSLGAIPDAGDADSVTELLNDPKSSVTEAYLTVSNKLRMATENGLPRILLLTSTLPGEGKSSSAFGLGRSLAKSGRRVLLIDADLRRPTFTVDGKKRDGNGFTNVLTGERTAEQVISNVYDNMWLMPAGDIPPNPSELFSGTKVEPMIRDLAAKYDVLILDSAPILGFVDAPMLASIADGTIIVFEAGRVRTSMAQTSVKSLQAVGAHIIGGLVTKFSAKHDDYGYGYAYSYDYNYSDEGMAKKARHAREREIKTTSVT